VDGDFQGKKLLNFRTPLSIRMLFNLQPISFRLNKVLNGKICLYALRTNRMHYFILNLFQQLTSTCLEQGYCSSSGGTFLYIQQMVCVMC
jgi:hypothetical protein